MNFPTVCSGRREKCRTMTILQTFVNAGIRAVRKADEERLAGSIKGVCPQMNELSKILVMIHLDNGGNNALYREWFDNFTKRGEDFEY